MLSRSAEIIFLWWQKNFGQKHIPDEIRVHLLHQELPLPGNRSLYQPRLLVDLEDELRPRRRPEQGPSQFRRMSKVVIVVVVIIVVAVVDVVGDGGAVGDGVEAVRRRLDAGGRLETRR